MVECAENAIVTVWVKGYCRGFESGTPDDSLERLKTHNNEQGAGDRIVHRLNTTSQIVSLSLQYLHHHVLTQARPERPPHGRPTEDT